MTELDRLLGSDLSDPDTRLVLADALDEAGRRREAMVMRALARVDKARGNTQAALDAAAVEARAANVAALRLAAVAGVDPASPSYDVCALVAESLAVGRESDGFPEVTLPSDVAAVVAAARVAGLLPDDGSEPVTGALKWHGLALTRHESLPHWKADYQAWAKAKDYRAAQARQARQ